MLRLLMVQLILLLLSLPYSRELNVQIDDELGTVRHSLQESSKQTIRALRAIKWAKIQVLQPRLPFDACFWVSQFMMKN